MTPRHRFFDCLFGVVFALGATRCAPLGPSCTPGAQRDCMRTSEAGASQRGTQSCDAYRTWSECLGVGVCSSPGETTLPVYSRCTTPAQCGTSDCAVCGHYVGVQNPTGDSICYAYCQGDTDCAPVTASTDTTPRCLLGQCTLLCHTTSQCPADSTCMPWADTTTANQFPGYDGLCE